MVLSTFGKDLALIRENIIANNDANNFFRTSRLEIRIYFFSVRDNKSSLLFIVLIFFQDIFSTFFNDLYFLTLTDVNRSSKRPFAERNFITGRLFIKLFFNVPMQR